MITGMTLRQFARRDLHVAIEARKKALAKVLAKDPDGQKEFILASLAIHYAKGNPDLRRQ